MTWWPALNRRRDARCAAPRDARRARGWATALLALASLVALAVAGARARAGDPEMAKFLLKGAKADIAKKEYAAAYTKLLRVEQEDPSLLEAAYWVGFVFERRDDPKAALAAYRRFLAGVAARPKVATPPKDEAGLAKKAQERVDAIAVGEVERRKLDDQFIDALLVFARANVVKDPLTAAQAIQQILCLRPDHAEARKLQARLGAAGPTPAAADPSKTPPAAGASSAPASARAGASDIKAVKTWKDILSDGTFAPEEDWETRADGVLVVQHRGGHLRTPKQKLETLTTFAMETECRITEAYETHHSLGFAFAFEKINDVRKFYVLHLEGESLILSFQDGDASGDAFRVELPAAESDAWRRFGVIVRGLHIDIFLDGKKVGEHDDARRKSLVGEPAILVVDCRGEIRTLRLGTPP
jgi:tetratricopeptide (TPR) repeat protein